MNKLIEVCKIEGQVDSKEVREIKSWYRSLPKYDKKFMRVVAEELYTNVDNYNFAY